MLRPFELHFAMQASARSRRVDSAACHHLAVNTTGFSWLVPPTQQQKQPLDDSAVGRRNNL